MDEELKKELLGYIYQEISKESIRVCFDLKSMDLDSFVLELLKRPIQEIGEVGNDGVSVLIERERKRRIQKRYNWKMKAVGEIESGLMLQKLESSRDKKDIRKLLPEQESVSLYSNCPKSKDELKEILFSWSNNVDAVFFNYPFADIQSLNMRFKSFEEDIYFLALLKYFDVENSKKKKEKSLNLEIQERSISLIDNPIFSMSSSLLNLDEVIEDEDRVLINDYPITDNYFLRTLIKEPEKIRIKDCMSLDEKDSNIIDVLYSEIDSAFYRDRSVVVEISKMANLIHGGVSGFAYKDIEKRIIKMSQYQIMGVIKEGVRYKDTIFSLSLLDNVLIYSHKETGARMARIVFGEVLYSQYIQSKTVKVYSQQLKELNLKISRILLFALQKERLNQYVHNNLSSKIKLDVDFFKSKVRMKYKTRKKISKVVEEALTEFKEKGILIEEFEVNLIGDFYVKFEEFSSEDIRKLGV